MVQDLRPFDDVQGNIIGRFAMSRDDAFVIESVLLMAGDGDYVEIGTLYGGSAIFAALVKKQYGLRGKVFAMDPMTGYYGGEDKWVSEDTPQASPEVLFRNAENFGVELELIRENSYPFPPDVHGNVILIDGDHTPDAVAKDWESAKQHSTKFVLFHDYNNPLIKDFVDSIEDWQKVFCIPTMAVMKCLK